MSVVIERDHLRSRALVVIACGVVLTGLVLGRSFLIPLAIAVLLWNLLEALIGGFTRIGIGRHRLPRWFAMALALGFIGFVFYLIAVVLLGQADAISAAWPRYEERLKSIVSGLAEWLGPDQSAKVREAIANIDVMRQAAGLFASAQYFMLSILLVVVYVGFLFSETPYIRPKIRALVSDGDRADDVERVLSSMSGTVRRYVWLKTLISVLTGVLSYAVLRATGVDFAETWALLIFLLNYIPNIGSTLGVLFPTLLALVQFDTYGPFLILALALTMIQMTIGSIIEPMLMGNSLNLSPFAIILSLTFWGSIWGIVGMFLSVPIMVLVAIVCANVPSWRWAAILLSKDGKLDGITH